MIESLISTKEKNKVRQREIASAIRKLEKEQQNMQLDYWDDAIKIVKKYWPKDWKGFSVNQAVIEEKPTTIRLYVNNNRREYSAVINLNKKTILCRESHYNFGNIYTSKEFKIES